MTRRTSFSLALLGLLVAPVAADEHVLIGPTTELFGASQTEWSARWWQWAYSFDRTKSPIADYSGEYCASRQSGDIWFLAGTYGSRRVVRECTVPYGKTLFFPLVNYIWFRPEGSSASCMQLASKVIAATNNPSALILEVDGRRFTNLAAHRLTTGCFSIVPGQPPDTVGSGYYVAINPLPRGPHLLNFGGVLPDLVQAVTYKITVE